MRRKQKYEQHIPDEQGLPFRFYTHTVVDTIDSNWHSDIELLLVTEGSGYVKYDTQEIEMKEGDVIVINSNVIHRTYSGSDASVTYHCLIIDEQFCKEYGIPASELVFEPKNQNEQIKSAILSIAELMSTASKRELSYQIKLKRELMTVLIELCDSYITGKASKKYRKNIATKCVRTALTYINENYKKTMTLPEIANHSGVSIEHLARAFKRHTGHTVFTYLNIVRCKNAAVLISEGSTVAAAAYSCGFEYASYFTRIYKKLMGKLPSSNK